MIETRCQPASRGVAQRAISREPRGNVRRIICALEVSLVAAVAVRRGVVVVIVRVALRTRNRRVLPRQRIFGI